MAAKRRKDQREATRQKLIAAGAAVFSRDGLAGARIADIAREAGVAMGTLYTHYKDKEALFEAVTRAGKEIILAGLAASQQTEGGRAVADRAAMEGVVAFAEVYGALFRLLLSRGAADNDMQREMVDAIVAMRVDELQQGLIEGWVRPGINPESAARCEVGAVFHLLDWWLDDPSKMDREALIDQLSSFRRFGVEGLEAE